MANGNSDYQTAVNAAAKSRTTTPNDDNIALARLQARFVLTGLGTETTGQYHVLGCLKTYGARVIPEQVRLRFTGSGTVDFKVQLVKVNAAGTQVALSAVSGNITALTAVVALTAIGGTPIGDTVELAQTDELRLVFTTGSATVAFPATAGIVAEVAYTAPGC
jgi:hypothetical protein